MYVDDQAAGGGGGDAAGLLPYYQDAGGAAPAVVVGAADQIQTAVGGVEVLGGDVESAHRPVVTSTSGVLPLPLSLAPVPVDYSVSRVSATALAAQGAVRLFANDGIRAFNRRVDGLRTEYEGRMAEILASDCGVPATDYPRGATEAEKTQLDCDRVDQVATAQSRQLGLLRAEMRRRWERLTEDPLDAAAEESAGLLNRAYVHPARVLKDLYSQGYLPSNAPLLFPNIDFTSVEVERLPYDLRRMDADDLADWIIDHDWFDPTGLRLPPDVVEALSVELADRIRDIDAFEDDNTLADLDSLLERFVDSSMISATVIAALATEDATSGRHLLERLRSLGDNDGDESTIQDLAETLKDLTESATDGMSEAEQSELAGQLLSALDVDDGLPPNSNELPVALSYLLKDGHYGDEFLHSLGNGLDDLDRDLALDGWRERAELSHAIDTLFDESDRDAAFDPMASYMSALGNNPSAALDFFRYESDRPEWYFKQRMWGHDDFDSLLSALDSATTHPELFTEDRLSLDRSDAARLVASAVDYLTHRDQVFDDDDGHGEWFTPGNVSGDGTVHAAHIVDRYLPAIDYTLDPENHDGDVVDQRFRNGIQVNEIKVLDERGLSRFGDMPVLEPGEAYELVQVAASSDQGLADLRRAFSEHQADQVQYAATADNLSADEVKDILRADGTLEGFLVNATGDAKAELGRQADNEIEGDNARKTWIIDEGIGLIPYGNKLEAHIIGPLLDHTLTESLTQDPDREEFAREAANNDANAVANLGSERINRYLDSFPELRRSWTDDDYTTYVAAYGDQFNDFEKDPEDDDGEGRDYQ